MSVFRQLKQAAFGSGRPKLQGKAQLALPRVPFYELDPLPWWCKSGWTWFFVTADAMITYVRVFSRSLQRQSGLGLMQDTNVVYDKEVSLWLRCYGIAGHRRK